MSILDDLRSLINAPSDTARARSALSAAMTSHIIPMQPPVMTDAHVTTLRTVIQLWPYPFAAERTMLTDILRHLEALQDAPVPTRCEETHTLDDWRTQYQTLDPELFQSDQ